MTAAAEEDVDVVAAANHDDDNDNDDDKASVLTKKEILSELKLTESEFETVDHFIEKEVQIRLEIALLEADAQAKMKAAEEAIANAKLVLAESNTALQNKTSGNSKDIITDKCAIDAIAQMISIAEKEVVAETVEEHAVSSTAEDEREEISGKEEEGEREGIKNSSTEGIDRESNENVAAAEEIPVGPPTIVRQTDKKEVLQINKITGYFKPKPKPKVVRERPKPEREVVDSNDDVAAIDKAEEEQEDTEDEEDEEYYTDEADDATSKTSNSSKKLKPNKDELPVDDNVNDEANDEANNQVEASFSILTLDDDKSYDNDDNDNDAFSGIEGTVLLLKSKVDECQAKLMDPSSSLEELTVAAQLMTQYAKTTKALKNAAL